MSAADDLRRQHQEWEQRQQAELLSRDDRPSFWLRALYRPQAGEESVPREDVTDGIPASPGELQLVLRPDMPWDEYAALRESLGIADRGLDSGQVQQMGYRGIELPKTIPGTEYVRAAQALQHEIGPAARTEYARRQFKAAHLTALSGRPQAR